MDVFTGIPGKIHDSRVLRLSDISNELPMMQKEYHILGDGAYPIREWLQIPFRDYGRLTAEEREYNRRLCTTRVLIENAFGLLKGRWRQLQLIDMYRVEKISRFIVACCVLHNLCIYDENMYIFMEMEDEVDNAEPAEENANDEELKRLGEEKRRRIKEKFTMQDYENVD